MSVLKRLSNLARGYYKSLGAEAPPDLPEGELRQAPRAAARAPSPSDAEPEEEQAEADGDVHRHPPAPKARRL